MEEFLNVFNSAQVPVLEKYTKVGELVLGISFKLLTLESATTALGDCVKVRMLTGNGQVLFMYVDEGEMSGARVTGETRNMVKQLGAAKRNLFPVAYEIKPKRGVFLIPHGMTVVDIYVCEQMANIVETVTGALGGRKKGKK